MCAAPENRSTIGRGKEKESEEECWDRIAPEKTPGSV